MDYIKYNAEVYERAYDAGWGNQYPDTIWISIFHRVIKKIVNKDNVKILDFGCSLGANTSFFRDIGYDVYGIDISQSAIEKCVSTYKFDPSHFNTLDLLNCDQSLESIFNTKFDIIFASDVMYYFNDDDIRKLTKIFSEGLTEKGLFVANMITYVHPWYKAYKTENKRKFVDIQNNNTISEDLYANIMNDVDDLRDLFGEFECIRATKSVIELEDTMERLDYIGMKKR